MIYSGWYLLLLAIPMLMLGEWLVRRIPFLSRFNIPAPVASGLLISLLVLLANVTHLCEFKLGSKVDEKWWTWFITTEIDWAKQPKLDVYRPFQVAFFTCIGLNASWALAKRGGIYAIIFLVLASVFAVLQNVIGVVMAKWLGVSPLLGVVCGAVTLTGGHSTAMGFADELTKAGLKNAAEIGVAAATFGLIAGGLLGGALGGALIRKNKLQPTASAEMHLESGASQPSGILPDFRALMGFGRKFFWHILILLVCIKLGAWISYGMQQLTISMPNIQVTPSEFSISFVKQKLSFPIYMGAMVLGVVIRNVLDLAKVDWIKTEVVDVLGSVTLGLFLTMAMMSLSLIDLASVAMAMLIILAVQVIVMAVFAWFVTFRLLGKDFDAAVMAGGHCGFGLGATSNAMASMKTLVENFGPAPRAFLIVPIVGGFLIDFPNLVVITLFINLVK